MIGEFAIFQGKSLGLGLRTRPLEGHDYEVVSLDLDTFYTKYGFVVCMSRAYLDYNAFAEGQLPAVHSCYRASFSNTAWLLIDHYGRVYRIEYFVSAEGGPSVDVTGVPFTGKNSVVYHTHGGDLMLVAGVVSVTDDREKLMEICHRRCTGARPQFHWYDLDEIVAELHKRFPLESKDETGK